MVKMIKNIIIFIIFILLIPLAYSDGGCIKIADEILVQLSSAPEVPRVHQQVSYLFSFGNKQGLLNREINGTLKITKSDETVFTKSFKIKDGILELKHIYENPGLYEIFFDFQIGNKNYKPEDFLVEAVDAKNNLTINLAYLVVGIIIGLVLAKFNKKQLKWQKT